MAAGYPLHIDATSDKGRGGLFLCLDVWRGWVLHAVKDGSENAAELQPAIERTVAAFEPPLATIRDLGRAGAKAVAGRRLEAVPDLVCHYHFLAAVGKQHPAAAGDLPLGTIGLFAAEAFHRSLRVKVLKSAGILLIQCPSTTRYSRQGLR